MAPAVGTLRSIASSFVHVLVWVMKTGRAAKNSAVNLLLLALGALFFALGFPNFVADWGLAPFAWISLVPVAILIHRIPWWSSPLWGALYGYATYALFNYWLATFNPVSFILVPTIYAGWFFIVFPLLKIADLAFKRYAYLAQTLIWIAFEIVKTKGFLGYAYGILGYSQYGWRSLIAIADIFGVMGVSILVVFSSFLIAAYLLESGFVSNDPGLDSIRRRNRPGRRFRVSAIIWAVLILAANIYGISSKVDYSKSGKWRPALIQHNVNTWLTGIDAWRQSLNSLVEESKKALKEKPDALVWSETSFVPSIEWHRKYRRQRDRMALINSLMSFLQDVNIPVIIGNNDSVMEGGKKLDYNATLLFDGGEIIDKYRKIHLVPFSEHFPYAGLFPRLMEYIQAQGTPLYTKGVEFTTFALDRWGGPRVSTLICFEDTFGYLARNFTLAGAEILVNTSNDSWSTAAACAIQHQNMAIFRAVENRRSMIRATTSGITCVIDPNGRTTARLDPFEQGNLVAEVPIYTGRKTIYSRFGDWFEKLILILALPTLIAALVLIAKRKSS